MKNIIFDLDGTLLNTLNDLCDSTNFALAHHNYPVRTIEEVRQFVGNGVKKLITRAMPPNATQEEFDTCFATFKAHYREHCMDNTLPYPGITEMLQQLSDAGVRMAIVSNKLHEAVSDLNRRFFSQYIDVAIGETPDVQRKPAPDMLHKAMQLIHSQAADTVYVGDSEVDLATARNAGIECISVLWGFRDKEFLEQHGAHTFAAAPSEILQLCDLGN